MTSWEEDKFVVKTKGGYLTDTRSSWGPSWLPRATITADSLVHDRRVAEEIVRVYFGAEEAFTQDAEIIPVRVVITITQADDH